MDICRAFDLFELILKIFYFGVCSAIIIFWCWCIYSYIKNKGWLNEKKTEELSTKDYIIIISLVFVGVILISLCMWGILQAYLYIKSMFC